MSEVLTNQELLKFQKTANQLYKEYKAKGGTLSFKNFIQREKDKGVFPLNLDLNEEIQKSLNEYNMLNFSGKGKKEESKILGLPTKPIIIAGSLIVIAFVAYKIIQNRKK
jgi:hypothetical protein